MRLYSFMSVYIYAVVTVTCCSHVRPHEPRKRTAGHHDDAAGHHDDAAGHPDAAAARDSATCATPPGPRPLFIFTASGAPRCAAD